MRRLGVLFLLLPVAALGASSADRSSPLEPEALLPPVVPWDGASRSLVAAALDPWITPAETSGFLSTPSYDETFVWLRRLASASERVQMVPIGESSERRTIWMVVLSAHGARSPETLRAPDKPVLLVQAGIHAGEIDGKDAGLMLLRDLAFGRLSGLVDRVHFLFVPILNVDGHERRSRLARVNQRGPQEMGWRTNARNLNLNRDYSKLDTSEIRAMVGVLESWRPDLYLDLHVTDGIDMQYDITWGFSGGHAHSPEIGRWLEERLGPALGRVLRAAGHIPGPILFPVDRNDFGQGFIAWEGGPRYSDGYGGSRHLATVLVENHALKPYDQRVLGTRVLLQAVLEGLVTDGEALRRATAADRERRWSELAVGFTSDLEPRPEPFAFLAIGREVTPSNISGAQRTRWNAQPITLRVPWFGTTRPVGSVSMPVAYWIPAAWDDVIERLALHGIQMEILDRPRAVTLQMYRLGAPLWAAEPFEGRLRVAATSTTEIVTRTLAPGSARVPTDQPLGVLAALLLEPSAPDSFLQWGFFNPIFQRTEYAEAYVLEPLAEQMLARDPELRKAFEQRLAEDPAFAADGRQRLDWFYGRAPLVDSRWRLYPVGRELP